MMEHESSEASACDTADVSRRLIIKAFIRKVILTCSGLTDCT